MGAMLPAALTPAGRPPQRALVPSPDMAVDVDPGAASSPTAPGDGERERPLLDLALLGGVAGVVTVVFLWPTIWHSLMVPLGPDVPVYLWWARVATASRSSARDRRAPR
jgi:hypothetical protein